MNATRHQGGFAMAFAAYLIWGLLPLYLRLMHDVPPVELVGWRTVFALPVCAGVIQLRRQWPEVTAALRTPRTLAALVASALLIGGNWLIYVTAIEHGHYFATSLGYYINPLVNILAGTALLGERLSPRQWGAVALATAGVLWLALAGTGSGGPETLAIALSLAATFAAYGLVRKLAPAGSLPGLTVEALVLLLPALLLLRGFAHTGTRFAYPPRTAALVIGLGALTPLPLALFAEAAKRLAYSTLGFIQFISPTTVFLLGLFLYHEPLRPAQLESFLAIWLALALFSWDMFSRR